MEKVQVSEGSEGVERVLRRRVVLYLKSEDGVHKRLFIVDIHDAPIRLLRSCSGIKGEERKVRICLVKLQFSGKAVGLSSSLKA